MNEKTRLLTGIRAVAMTNQGLGPAIGGGLRAHVINAEPQAAAIHSAAHAARPWGKRG